LQKLSGVHPYPLLCPPLGVVGKDNAGKEMGMDNAGKETGGELFCVFGLAWVQKFVNLSFDLH